MTDEKEIEHLWNAAGALTPLNHTKKLLKSYYLTISRKVARYKFALPEEKFGEIEMCEKCSSCWFDGNFSMKLISAKIRTSKAKRLVDDLESGKKLTKKQKNRAKWYRKKIFSFVQFNCKLCNHKTNVRLLKPVKEDEPNVIPEDIPVQKQKKKKKDKFAGLKIDKLLHKSKIKTEIKSINAESIKCDSQSDIQSTSKNIPRKTDAVIQSKKTNITLTDNTSRGKQQLNKTESNSLNKKSKKKVKSKMTNVHIVSKTQHKNTILQLAQMLKQSGNSNSNNQNNKSENRLKNLLR